MFKVRSWVGLLCGWLLALLAAAVPSTALAVAPVVAAVVADGQASVHIDGGSVDYLLEEEGQPALTPEQVMAPSFDPRWKRYEGRRINLLRQRVPGWFRFSIENRASQPSVLGIDWPLLLDVRVYQYDPLTGQQIASHASGLKVSPESKQHDTGYAFPLVFREGGRTTVLVRVHSQASMVVPLTVWNRDAYQASRHSHNLLMGMLFGVLAIMLLYNTTLLVFTRDRNYAFYSVYLLGAVLYELATTGYGPLLIWGESAWLTRQGYELFASFTFLTATLFVHNFLDIGKVGLPHMRRGTWLLVTYWVTGLVVVLLYPAGVTALRMPLVGGVSGLFGVYVSFVQMARGNVSARFFTAGWTVLMVGTVAQMLALTGTVDGNWFTEYGQHMGFMIEILLLSVALADRIKRDRRAHKQAQAQSLALTLSVQHEREEKIKAQEEAIGLQTRAHDELAGRVLDRTAELEQAKMNLEIANTELAKLSVTDALTQVHNRRYFDEVLAREHGHSARTGVPLALLLVDIDHFKKINDSCGHLAGDECLRLVAATLTQTVGHANELIARFGGEEFALVLPGVGPEQAFELAERVRLAVENITFIYRGKRVPLSISIGVVARVTAPHESVPDFVAEADAAMYRAKQAGRNQVKLAA